jgi:hypothetical protein
MRRIGGVLFLLLLAACDKTAGDQKVAAVAVTSTGPPAPTTSTVPTSSTSTSTVAPSTTTTTSAPATTTTVAVRSAPPAVTVTVATTAPAARLVTTTTPAAAGGCDPNYSGACVPIDPVDVDCGGGSGNGPSYVYAKNFNVVGKDIYGLDTDHNGFACES